jgi:hypothetical protein
VLSAKSCCCCIPHPVTSTVDIRAPTTCRHGRRLPSSWHGQAGSRVGQRSRRLACAAPAQGGFGAGQGDDRVETFRPAALPPSRSLSAGDSQSSQVVNLADALGDPRSRRLTVGVGRSTARITGRQRRRGAEAVRALGAAAVPPRLVVVWSAPTQHKAEPSTAPPQRTQLVPRARTYCTWLVFGGTALAASSRESNDPGRIACRTLSLEVLSITVQEICRALGTDQAGAVSKTLQARAGAMCIKSALMASEADDAMAGELAAQLAALYR